MATLRELSKQEFISSVGNTNEAISNGALQRIADATELMAKDRIQIERDLKFYKEKYLQKVKEIENLESSISAYKGVITKLKRKNSNLQVALEQ